MFSLTARGHIRIARGPRATTVTRPHVLRRESPAGRTACEAPL